MPIALLMLMCWQGLGNRYQEPFNKSLEATYAGSDIKPQIEAVRDSIVKRHPILANVATIGYGIGIKKQARFTSSRLSLIPNTISTYNYDASGGSIVILWRF